MKLEFFLGSRTRSVILILNNSWRFYLIIEQEHLSWSRIIYQRQSKNDYVNRQSFTLSIRCQSNLIIRQQTYSSDEEHLTDLKVVLILLLHKLKRFGLFKFLRNDLYWNVRFIIVHNWRPNYYFFMRQKAVVRLWLLLCRDKQKVLKINSKKCLLIPQFELKFNDNTSIFNW